MIKKISIQNYKSIVSDEIELGRVNVFIGENGAGKSNILEAVAMFSAAQGLDLSIENLYSKGVRVVKPQLTFSSFLRKKQIENILIEVDTLEDNGEQTQILSDLVPNSSDSIHFKWKDLTHERGILALLSNNQVVESLFDKIAQELNTSPEMVNNIKSLISPKSNPKLKNIISKTIDNYTDEIRHIGNLDEDDSYNSMANYQIYALSTPALRGITKTSLKQPLGLNGEGLDLLLSAFEEEEWQLLTDYSHFISWLDRPLIDEKDVLKSEGHRLGRSTSRLYFVDQFMRKNNNIFAAENANEGALYVLFYLALFISKKTPSFFAIDNIETALNPKICRELMTSIAALAEKTDKQVLITTHNPAILDGINLNDDQQRLFVVSRTDEGHTKTKRIQFKPQNGQSKYKLSELWMRGKLGGIPQNFL